MIGAIMRDSEQKGWRIFRTPDQKKIAAGWKKVAEAGDLAERTARAEAIRACAAFCEKNYRKAHPLRTALADLGFKDRKLAALQAAQVEASAVIERGRPAMEQIAAETFGGGAKLRERFARELADGASLDRACRGLAEEWRLRSESLPAGLERRQAEDAAERINGRLRQQLRDASKGGDMARWTEVALEVRAELRRHAERLEQSGGQVPTLDELRSPLARRDAHRLEERAAQVREHAAAILERMEQQARRWEERGDKGDRDAGRMTVALRTDRERLREALARGDNEAIAKAGAIAGDRLHDSERLLGERDRSEREPSGHSLAWEIGR